jgi:hypothetical protein
MSRRSRRKTPLSRRLVIVLAVGLAGLMPLSGPALQEAGAAPAPIRKPFRRLPKRFRDIVSVARDLSEGRPVAAKLAALRNKYDDLGDVMRIFKHRSKKGLGAGPKAPSDGIEDKIIRLSMRPLTRMQLAKEKDDLVRMGYVAAAVGALSKLYAPDRPFQGMTPADWRKHADQTRKYSLELVKAVESGNPLKVKRVATKLNYACNGCHSTGTR